MERIALVWFAFVFAAMVAVSGEVAQRKLPDSVQQVPKSEEEAPQPANDTFQAFRYRMAFSATGAHVAGFQEVAVKSGNPDAPARSAKRVTGMNKSTDVTLKRGVVHMDSSFNQWIGRSKEPQKPRDVVINTFNETGQKSSSMHLRLCVVAEYQSVPDLNSANGTTIQVMTLHCAGVQRSTP